MCRQHRSALSASARRLVGARPWAGAVGAAALLFSLAPQGLRCEEVSAGKEDSIGYATVAEALIAVQKGMDTEARMERGWTVVEAREKGIPVHWFFTHTGHPAHPAAIKRTMTYEDGAWDIGMAMLCEGPRTACDKLAEQFRVINERLEKSWKG